MMNYTKQLIEPTFRRGVLVLLVMLGLLTQVSAQVNYQQQYATAKSFFKEGKYNLAMESFKTLVTYDKDNPFSEYASYYYALSAYNQGYKSVAKDMLTQLKTLYPTWEQVDEANLWLVKIHFDNAEYFQGLRVAESIKNNRIKKDAHLLEKAAIDSIKELSTLSSLAETYPEDELIGRQYAKILSQNLSVEGSQERLQILIDRFKLKKSDFIEEAPKSFFKDKYAISVLFPFVVNTIDPTPAPKRNQFVLDLYEGMQMAVDTLKYLGVQIDLRAYDTERSVAKTQSILEQEELKSSDLIVSPLFSEMNAVVQDFSHQNKINAFNPVSGNTDMINGNPYGFLFQPSTEVIGQRSAEFVASNESNKRCMVFYGESKQDSVMAANFIVRAREMQLEILKAPLITKDNTKKILEILQTPTGYDEFDYPNQFTLPKDSVDCIFVASNDPLIYAKVIGSVETRRDSIMIVGSEAWLDQQSVDYDKYESLGIVLYAPTFTRYSNTWYKGFQRSFVRQHGRITTTLPYTDYAKIGFDFMIFIGEALKKYGVYFQEGLNKQGVVPGYMGQAYDFRNSQVNQYVPFIKLNQGLWEVVDIVNKNESKPKK